MDGKNSIASKQIYVLIAVLCMIGGMNHCFAAKSVNSEGVKLANGDSMEPPPPDYQKAAMVNVELGLGYLSQGQIARAKGKLTHAIKLAPNSPETHSAMAYFKERVGDVKDAEKEHKKAIKLGMGGGAVNNNYGAFLCRQGRIKEADVAFQKALADKYYPRTADVYENAGVCALKGSDLEAASHYLKTALKQDPKRVSALLELADLSLRIENYQEAKQYLGQFKKLAEPTSRSLWLGIQVAHALHDEDALASQAMILKNLFEESPEYQLYQNSEFAKL
jgi:type IV pilus assembly protein PilF